MARPLQDSSALFQLTGVGVVETAMPSGRLVRVNRTFCELLGYSEAELLGLSFRDLTHPDDLPRDEAAFLALQRGETRAGRSLTRVLRKDGSVRWLELSVTVLGDEGGTRNLAVVNDVTERVEAEVALRASEGRYRTLFGSIDEGFCTVEVLFGDDGEPFDYRFLEMNPAFERQTGLTNAVGRTMRDLAPQHERFWFETYGRVAKTGEPTRFEHEAAALGRHYDAYAFRVGGPDDNRVAILFNDVSERKRAERASTLR